MEQCARGFSFVPDNKVNAVMDLQYIEGSELERTWKVSRRQRLKEQEQKIWEEFVKEQDIVKMACTEDPYQFLHQLPENCLKELLETELQKMKKETQEDVIVEQPNQGEGDHPTEKQVLHTVTFADDDKGDCMFHIFDDENDLNNEMSGPEEEVVVESPVSEPSTVRERSEAASPHYNDLGSTKSSENVTNLIESSINCARVKDLRLKINDEMKTIMESLESQDVMSVEQVEVSRKCRRSLEFCARFNRIHMYQLQRQVHDIKRAEMSALPFAVHTQFQSQMLRIVSLHQNLLHALQIFHKSFEQTSCLRESATMLHTLVQFTRDISALCSSVPTPKDFAAVQDLYNDELTAICDKLDEAVTEYSSRVAHFINNDNATNDNTSTATSRKSKSHVKPGKKGRYSQNSKLGTKSWSTKDTDARLSMYSLETLRLNLGAKPSGSKDNQTRSVKNKSRVPESAAGYKQAREKSPKKSSPRSRRPLMRAPVSAQTRARTHTDTDICTLVEAVDNCTSSHMSREPSPRAARRVRGDNTPRTSRVTTPRQSSTSNYPSPKNKTFQISPKSTQTKKISNSVRSDTQKSPSSKVPYILPLTKIQCVNKEFGTDRTDRKIAKESIDTGNTISPKDHFSKNVTKETDNCQEIIYSPKESKLKHGNSVNSGSQERTGNCGSVTDTDLKNSSRKSEERDGERSERGRSRSSSTAPAGCEVSRLLRQLCSGDGSVTRNERVTGAKNAQLFCMSGSPSRQPSTPQLLRILEETIQKKTPKPMYQKRAKDPDRHHLSFNITEKTANNLFQYRTKFVQHMLTSPMYANSVVGKPWEMIGSVSEKIVDDLLMNCAKEMEIKHVLQDLYNCETN